MRRYVVGLTVLASLALGAAAWLTAHGGDADATRDLLARYCTECHNAAEFTANLVIEPGRIDAIAADPEHWEKIVRKLRAETMPPEGPRPAHAAYAQAARFVEAELDAAAAARPNPGDVPAFRRLTRTEYRNAVRDLLALDDLPAELDFELLLPADNAASGFDNIADLLFVSPVVMERYVAAAQKIARLAVGDVRTPVLVNIHRLGAAAAG
jgi:mono/diheme cytochrome c family protein